MQAHSTIGMIQKKITTACTACTGTTCLNHARIHLPKTHPRTSARCLSVPRALLSDTNTHLSANSSTRSSNPVADGDNPGLFVSARARAAGDAARARTASVCDESAPRVGRSGDDGRFGHVVLRSKWPDSRHSFFFTGGTGVPPVIRRASGSSSLRISGWRRETWAGRPCHLI